jgi:hypothetical protein
VDLTSENYFFFLTERYYVWLRVKLTRNHVIKRLLNIAFLWQEQQGKCINVCLCLTCADRITLHGTAAGRKPIGMHNLTFFFFKDSENSRPKKMRCTEMLISHFSGPWKCEVLKRVWNLLQAKHKILVVEKRRESTKILEILEFDLVRSLNFCVTDDILHPIVLLSKKDENY